MPRTKPSPTPRPTRKQGCFLRTLKYGAIAFGLLFACGILAQLLPDMGPASDDAPGVAAPAPTATPTPSNGTASNTPAASAAGAEPPATPSPFVDASPSRGSASIAPSTDTPDAAIPEAMVFVAKTDTPTHTPTATDTPRPTPTDTPTPRIPPTPTATATDPVSRTLPEVVALVPHATLAAPPPTPTPTLAVPGQPATVLAITDGYAIDVYTNGRIDAVRYIGIDTPERGQLGYRAATEANRALVAGKTVILQADQSDRDQFDRLLRNVFLEDGTHVNAQLVAQGWAQPVEYPPDTQYAADLRRYAVEAAHAQRGFWSGTSSFDGAMSYALVLSTANIRTGPSTDHDISGSASADTPLTVFGRNESADWLQVRLPNRDGGWIFAQLVTLNVPANQIPIADAPPSPTALPPTPKPTTAPDTTPTATGTVRIIRVDKGAEFVVLQNQGAEPVNLRGWTLLSVRGEQSWTVPYDFVLQPGATVTIHALSGTDDAQNLYSGFGSNIWNNSESDDAILYDANGNEVSRFDS